ncbi:MAG: efflux RND transporter permease subunit, partial [Candidatus Eisenbacteria sp.]|nr:efflux RND transporter permease subunit [Candidatus Eisenbacteria bacterium]
MNSLPRFAVGRPVLVNLLMVGVVLGGLLALFAMPQELEPNVSFNWVFVTIPYTGASPKETEDLIVIPVEQELDKLEHVDELLSTAGEGWAFFFIKFEEMSRADFVAAMQEVRMHVDQAVIPSAAEDPVIEDFGSDDFTPVISISLTFEGDEEQAARVAEDLSDEIKRIADVAKTQISGLEDREIWVEVDPVKLNAQKLSLGAVVRTLADRNVNLPGGSIEVGRSEFLVRAISRYESPEEIAQTVLKADAQGRIVHLSDVAEVRMVRAESTVLSRLAGKRSITISVSKGAGGATYAIVDRIKELVEKYRMHGPSGINFEITRDSTKDISKIIGVLRNNGLVGIVFIFCILLLFLGTSNALLATMGIPLSFLVAFVLMRITGQTINGSSLFALIIVLGIIVD